MSNSSYPTFADELRTLQGRNRANKNDDGINARLINVRNALCAACTSSALLDNTVVSIDVADPPYDGVQLCEFVDLCRKLGLTINATMSTFCVCVSWANPPLEGYL